MKESVIATLLLLSLTGGCNPNSATDPAAVEPSAPVGPSTTSDLPPAPLWEQNAVEADPATNPAAIGPEDLLLSSDLDSEARQGNVDDDRPTTHASSLDDAQRALIAGDYEEAVRLANQALKKLPDVLETQVAVAGILIRSKHVGEGIQLLEQARREGVADVKHHLMLASAYRLQARKSSDRETQLASTRRAAEIIRQLKQAGQLASYGKKGLLLYVSVLLEQSKGCAQAGLPQEALTALRDIMQTGFGQITALTDDSAFDPLRELPEFIQLVEEYRGKIRRQLQIGARQVMSQTEPFPFEFTLPDYRDKPVKSSDFAGKVLLVDFWGTWCGPCRMQTPHLIRLQREYADDLAIVGIAYEKTPRGTWKSQVREYVENHAVAYPCVLGDTATKEMVPDLQSFPTLLLLDRTGKVRIRLRGLHSYEMLDAAARLLIDERADAT